DAKHHRTRGHSLTRAVAPDPSRRPATRGHGGSGAGRGAGHASRRRTGSHPRRPRRNRQGGRRSKGGRVPPGNKAFHFAEEDEKARHLPARVMPAPVAAVPPGWHSAGGTSPPSPRPSRSVRSAS